MLRLLLAIAFLLPPRPAAYVAGLLEGVDPGVLLRICWRESRCERVSVHERDAHLSGSSWGGQVQLGHLEPDCQPRGRGRRWATRGAWGLNAAAHWPFLPPCYQPEWLDVPLVSASVAASKWLGACRGKRRSGWCPSSRSRT